MTPYLAERLKQPHVVYELRDDLGVLLYAGCTSNLPARLQQHKATKWWPRVSSVQSTDYSDGYEAYSAEDALHRRERGAYVGNTSVPRLIGTAEAAA